MPVLSSPRDPLIDKAMKDAMKWCDGHMINGERALAHAVTVTRNLDEQLGPDLAVELAAAALLHDAPLYAPYTPEDLDALLSSRYNRAVQRIVRGLHAEHVAFDEGRPSIPTKDVQVLTLSTVDKTVNLLAWLHQARRSGDFTEFLSGHPELRERLPYFAEVHAAGVGVVPEATSVALGDVLDALTASSCRVA